MKAPEIRLNDQTIIPQIGLGTWQMRGEQCRQAVYEAMRVGYRHIDTAAEYHNHEAVAEGLNDAALPREDYFLTSKVWRTELHYDELMNACKRTLQELDTAYLDLFLVHWPNTEIPMKETFRALEDLREQGFIKAIGVSNFTISHLKQALETGVDLAVNQVEFHPSLYQKKLKEFCNRNDIHLTAYSPLARGKDLELESVVTIAEKRGVPRGQVIINWIRQKGLSVIPKSSTPERIQSNFAALNWELTDKEIERIDAENTDNRLINPDFAEFED